MSLKCFGVCFSLSSEKREKPMSEIFLQTNKKIQTKKQCAFCIRIKCPPEHNMSHPELCTAMRDEPAGICTWDSSAAPVPSQKEEFPEQLPAARMGSGKWLCHGSCAASLELHHSTGGNRPFLWTLLHPARHLLVSVPCNVSPFTRIFPDTRSGVQQEQRALEMCCLSG